jgi:cell division protease FtsH
MFGMEEGLANFHFDKENGNYSEKTKEIIDDSVQKIINDSHTKVTKIITKNKKLTQKLANELLEKETLEGKELNKILNSNKKRK